MAMSKKENKENILKKKRSLLRILLKIAMICISFLLVLSVVIVIIIQTQSFRSWLAVQISSIVNESIQGELSFSGLDVGLFPGHISLYDVLITVEKDTMVYSEKIVVDFFIEPLLSNKVIANNVSLKKPILRFYRNTYDSLWTFEKLAKPSEDTTSSEPPDWSIRVKKLIIDNADIIFCDSLSKENKPFGIDYLNMSIANFNLNLKTEINLKTMDVNSEIRQMNFLERNSGWTVDNLALKVKLNSKGIFVDNFQYKSPYSEINLSASISEFDVFHGGDIHKAVLKTNVQSQELSSKDIMLLGKVPIRIEGNYQVDFNAEGMLGDKLQADIRFQTGTSDIFLDYASIQNIFDPKNIVYEANFGESKVSKMDIVNALPDIDLASVPNITNAQLKNTYIKGFIDSVFTDFDIKTSLANSKGNASLGFADVSQLNYSVDFTIEKLNLAPILNNNELVSSINSRIVAQGKGIEMNNLQAKIHIDSRFSYISDYKYKQLLIKADYKDNVLNLDSLYIVFGEKSEEDNEPNFETAKSSVLAILKLNIKDFKEPVYSLDVDYKSVNLSKLLKNDEMPVELTGALSLNGKGMHLDSIQGNLKNNIKLATFRDRSLFPFSAELQLDRFANDNRKLTFNSDYIDLTLEGRFNYNNFFSLLKTQGSYLSYYFFKRINSINPIQSKEYIDSLEAAFERITYFDPIEFTIRTDVKDISILSTFLDDMEIYTEMFLEAELKVDSTTSMFEIDTLNITNLQFKNSEISLLSTPINIKSGLSMSIKDSLPKIDNMNLSFACMDRIFLNDNTLSQTKASINYDGDTANFLIGAIFNNDIDFSSSGNFVFGMNYNDLSIDELNLKYKDTLLWKANSPLQIRMYEQNMEIKSFELIRNNAEKINVFGRIKDSAADSLSFLIENFPLKDLKHFSTEKVDAFESITGNISALKIDINGPLSDLDISLMSSIKNLKLAKETIGDIVIDLQYSEKMASGLISLSSPRANSNKNLIDVKVHSLPMNIPPDTSGNLFIKNRRINIKAQAEKIPLDLAQIFLEGSVKGLNGNANLKVDISGFAPDEINFSGVLNIVDSRFVLSATNIAYTARGSVLLNDKEISLENVKIANTEKDISLGGYADIYGKILLKDYIPDYFDINLSSKGLLVLSQESKRTMPDLFGEVVIATGDKPLSFFGSMNEPNVGGDLKLIRANLTLPKQTQQNILFSSVQYNYSGHPVKKDTLINLSDFDWDSTMKSKKDEESKRNERGTSASDFGKLINYDINIQILNPLNALIELGPFQQVWAKVDAKDDARPLHFVMERGTDQPRLYGNLVVKEGSKLDFYKSLSTEGEILLPTGDITNPGLDLKAVYHGKNYSNEEQRFYTVTIYVKGTKEKPNIIFDYSINGEPAVGDTSSIRENAMLLLIFGRTKNEFSAKSEAQGDIVSETVSSSASSLISSQLTSALQKTGVITGADIEFSEGQIDFSNAKVTLTGQIIGNVMWRFGGTVADFANNNEISIDIPIGSVHPIWMNNIVLQLTRSISPATTTIRNANEWEVKMKFGGNW